MDDAQKVAKLRPLTDAAVLDVAACNMATSHPSVIGFPDSVVTARSSTMAAELLHRIEKKDEGLISMGYVSLLEAMVQDNPRVLTADQRESAQSQCVHHYSVESCTVF